jgi:predicted glutamine amidotransferase
MCKVMMISGVKDSDKLWKFMYAAAPHLTEDDPHGFGYAAVSATTGLFGQKWVNPDDAFVVDRYSDADKTMIANLGVSIEVPDRTKTYAEFGTHGADIHTAVLHGRFSTNTISIENTHPFVIGSGDTSTALIHNGVISNTHVLKNITSTCDSECILNLYSDSAVATQPSEIQRVADMLSGWYACAVITKLNGAWIMDIFKETASKLFVTWVNELNAAVFCTTEEILYKTCKDAKMTYGTVFEVKADNLTRIECVTGKVIHQEAFVSDLFDAQWTNAKTPDIGTVVNLPGWGETLTSEEEERDVWDYMQGYDRRKGRNKRGR